MKPLELIQTAKRLASMSRNKPRQSDLRRAISTAYYALFHCVCRNCADCLIGTASADRSAPAWQQAYRSVVHGTVKHQCKNRTIMCKFPKDIEDFGNCFVELQFERHKADYDPNARFTRTEILTSIDSAESAIRAFGKTRIKDRRAFAAWTSMPTRKD